MITFLHQIVYATAIAATVSVLAAANDNPVWTSTNKLQQPVGDRQWIHLGSPVAPQGLNNTKVAFPKFHNVYGPLRILEQFKKTGEYKKGSMFAKELPLTPPPAEFPHGSQAQASGRWYFPNGLDVMAKD